MADSKTQAVDSFQHDPEKTSQSSREDSNNVGADLTTRESAGYTAVEWTTTRVIAFISLCLAYVGAQIILYFTGGALTYIAVDIGTTVPNWLLTANTLAVAATCPFVGYITDLLGRRWVCIFGALLLVISSILVATAHSLGQAVAGETLGGIGAGICELTALAGVAEITPVKWRGVSLAIVTFSIVPFMPYLLYIIECEMASTWRWSFMIVGGWNFISLVGLLFCYRPPARHNVDGLSTMEILSRIDWIGAFLSISGVTLFLVGLQAGGYQYPWTDAKVLAPLIIGILLILAFPIWEWKGPKYPMAPAAIFKGQRVVTMSFICVFIAGMVFYSVLGFFPVMLTSVYVSSPVTAGVRALGYPIGILAGACIVGGLISYTNGHIWQMFLIGSAIMTAFTGALAGATVDGPGFAVAMATIASFGIGTIIVPALTIALYASPDHYIGTTGALSLSVRFLGGSVGTTIFYNIFNTKSQTAIPQYVAEAVIPLGYPEEGLLPLLQAIVSPVNQEDLAIAAVSQYITDQNQIVQVLTAASLAAREALVYSLSFVWYAAIPFGVLCMAASLALPNIKKYMTNRVAVDIH